MKIQDVEMDFDVWFVAQFGKRTSRDISDNDLCKMMMDGDSARTELIYRHQLDRAKEAATRAFSTASLMSKGHELRKDFGGK